MTDITDHDRRQLREDAKAVINKTAMRSSAAVSIARYILATVDAPEPTLAEELRCLTRRLERTTDPDKLLAAAFFSAAARAEQIEKERDEARAEVERLTAVNEELRRTDNYREFKEFLTVQKGAESNAEAPDPADVKPGEAWIVEVNGKRGTAMKDGDSLMPWGVVTDGTFSSRDAGEITLVTRLVPAPRVITNPDELDALAEGSIVLDNEGDPATRRAGGLDYRGVEGVCSDVHHYLPVTVLWEPGA